jgi:uncharacterized protein YbjT (DUF2867 family)
MGKGAAPTRGGAIGITGANGFVGRNLVRLLLAELPPFALRCVVRDAERARRELPHPDLPLRVADVRDPASLDGAFDGCFAVVHTVAIPTERRARFADVNVNGTANVVEEAKRSGVGRIVHMSVLGADPESRFGFLRSKGEGQRVVETSRLPFVVLRPSILFGPGDDFFPRLAVSLRFPVVPVPGDGTSRFQPLHVADLAQCIRVALTREDLLGRSHEIGGPEAVSYDELLSEAMTTLGMRRPRLHLPVALMKPGAIVMSLLSPDPPVTAEQLDLLKADNAPPVNEIDRFGVRPRPFRGGLDYLVDAR